MGRTCESSGHRRWLSASDIAVCYHCFTKFSPLTIVSWCDGERQDQTALCPHCGVDAVVGFNGTVDPAWVQAKHKSSFG